MNWAELTRKAVGDGNQTTVFPTPGGSLVLINRIEETVRKKIKVWFFSTTAVFTVVSVTVTAMAGGALLSWTVTGEEPIPSRPTGDGLAVTGEKSTWGGRAEREALAAELIPLLLAEATKVT